MLNIQNRIEKRAWFIATSLKTLEFSMEISIFTNSDMISFNMIIAYWYNSNL